MFRHADVDVCVLCASYGSSQCCILRDLQFVNTGRGCKRRSYGRGGTLQSRSHDCLIGSHECLLLITPYVAVSDFILCIVLVLRCCECVCCMEFGVKGNAFGSAVLFILRSRLILYSAGSGVNRLQVGLSGFSVKIVLFCPDKKFM